MYDTYRITFTSFLRNEIGFRSALGCSNVYKELERKLFLSFTYFLAIATIRPNGFSHAYILMT